MDNNQQSKATEPTGVRRAPMPAPRLRWTKVSAYDRRDDQWFTIDGPYKAKVRGGYILFHWSVTNTETGIGGSGGVSSVSGAKREAEKEIARLKTMEGKSCP